MSVLGTVVVALARRFEAMGIPYMVIGGVANIQWGRNRLTQDVDVTIRLAEDRLPELLAGLSPDFRARPDDPLAFARELAIVPLQSVWNIRVDLILGRLDLEFEAIDRAVAIDVDGVPVRFITAEDLLLQKIISDRPRDRDDVEEIARRQLGLLDAVYLRSRVVALADSLEQPELVHDLERLLESTS